MVHHNSENVNAVRGKSCKINARFPGSFVRRLGKPPPTQSKQIVRALPLHGQPIEMRFLNQAQQLAIFSSWVLLCWKLRADIQHTKPNFAWPLPSRSPFQFRQPPSSSVGPGYRSSGTVSEPGDPLLFSEEKYQGDDQDDGSVARPVSRLQDHLSVLRCSLVAHLQGALR